jgi:hypothetical protein
MALCPLGAVPEYIAPLHPGCKFLSSTQARGDPLRHHPRVCERPSTGPFCVVFVLRTPTTWVRMTKLVTTRDMESRRWDMARCVGASDRLALPDGNSSFRRMKRWRNGSFLSIPDAAGPRSGSRRTAPVPDVWRNRAGRRIDARARTRSPAAHPAARGDLVEPTHAGYSMPLFQLL